MNLKRFLPFENFTLTTRLSIEDIRTRISNNIEPKQAGIFSFSKRIPIKPYEGQLLDNTFTINRIINYRNSFLPIINGQITTSSGHTQIHLRMRPMIFVTVFIFFWLSVVGLVCVGTLVSAILHFQKSQRDGFSPMLIIPFGMFIFGCLLIFFGFKVESKKSKKFLSTLFEAEENN